MRGTQALGYPVIDTFGEGSLSFAACFFFFSPALPNDEHGQLEKKNANGFAITTFSSC